MAGAWLVVRALVAETDRRDFDHWYRSEHLPDAMKAFGASRASRGWSLTDPSCTTRFIGSPTLPRRKPSAPRRRSAR